MQFPFIMLGYCGVGLVAGPAVMQEGKGPSAQDPRIAIKRALPYLARQTSTWIKEQECNSCHQVPHALWAMNAARAGGFEVDDGLTEWNRWAVAFVLRETEKSDGNDERARERTDELYQLLLAGSTADVEPNAEGGTGSDTAGKELFSLLKLGQDPDGHWHAGGKLPGQIRPQKETDEVTTMWSLHTLRSHRGDGHKHEVAGERAKPLLEARGTSLEHLVLRYLLAFNEGESGQSTALRQRILSHQNSDGGWGWLLEGASDAMATGQALYALSYVKPEHRREAVAHAHQFLLRTQQADGSWHVPSTLEGQDAKPYAVSNDWGTAWALIGLMRTIRR